MSALNAPHLHDETAAYRFVEARVWPEGRVCPHCGTMGKSGPLGGDSTRIGVYKCYACRKPFTVKVGTIFESSHVKLHIWLQAIFLLCASKKGMSTNQLHRVLGVTLKTAWFMAHRIREAMTGSNASPLGGEGRIVEADETYYGKSKRMRDETTSGRPFTHSKKGRGIANKMPIVALVERGGSIRSFHIDRADKPTVASIVVKNVARESVLHTDESRLYAGADGHVAGHKSVRHADGEYVRGDVHTNTVEGSFGIFKRGMMGVYQHCQEKHLHRYLSEFDFRYNSRVALGVNDEARAVRALKGIVGKRLTYRTTHSGKHAS